MIELNCENIDETNTTCTGSVELVGIVETTTELEYLSVFFSFLTFVLIFAIMLDVILIGSKHKSL